MLKCLFIPAFVSLALPCTVFSYGEKVDSLLLWQERAIMTLTNACRMAPIAFRDRYLGNTTIMLPETYPTVAPLYWNRELNAASRYHCVEMGLSCGMTHECNGVSFSDRIKTFYSKSSSIAENIAAGYQTPQQVVTAWLLDGQSASTAAPDGNGDGHRANIMSSRYREIGCGYYLAGSGKTAKSYWCQDFGGGKSTFTYHPVSAASHFFFTRGQTTFWAAIYDTSKTVSDISLVLDGTKTAMSLDLGSAFAGTYAVTLPVATACRNYAVEITFADGRTLRYPETGTLPTVGEGTCGEGGSGTWSSGPEVTHGNIGRDHITIRVEQHGDALVLLATPNTAVQPSVTTIIDCKGIIGARARWNGPVVSLPFAALPQGLLLLVHTYPDGSSAVTRKVLSR